MIRFVLTPALIYIDPSNTSLLMQILAPVFVVLSVLGGQLKKRITTIFRRRSGRSSEENQ
jgi:hypothetical protein